MRKRAFVGKVGILSAIALVGLGLASCGNEDSDGTRSPAAAQPNSAQAIEDESALSGPSEASSAGQTHDATGKIQAINKDAGTVTIAHGPVASLNWSSMTMEFQVQDQGALANLKQGEQVKFSFSANEGGHYLITQITSVQ